MAYIQRIIMFITHDTLNCFQNKQYLFSIEYRSFANSTECASTYLQVYAHKRSCLVKKIKIHHYCRSISFKFWYIIQNSQCYIVTFKIENTLFKNVQLKIKDIIDITIS